MENYPAHTTQPNRWIITETMKTIQCIEVNHIIFFCRFHQNFDKCNGSLSYLMGRTEKNDIHLDYFAKQSIITSC